MMWDPKAVAARQAEYLMTHPWDVLMWNAFWWSSCAATVHTLAATADHWMTRPFPLPGGERFERPGRRFGGRGGRARKAGGSMAPASTDRAPAPRV